MLESETSLGHAKQRKICGRRLGFPKKNNKKKYCGTFAGLGAELVAVTHAVEPAVNAFREDGLKEL